ncbi:MAG: hypothetical protein EON90_12780 [Brevundimonas sp.]|nr:MAG: hypothetical protein EON90_12780 [Brevundimonas sp.]
MLNRRTALVTALACALPGAASAQDRFDYRGFSVDLTAAAADKREALSAYIRQQIDLVESLAIRPDIKAWFRTVALTVDPALNMPGRFSGGRLTLDDSVSPPDNPVLLHELLHGYMDGRLRPTGEVRAFYDQAKASGDWPPRSYMLTNVAEFFAMTGSVALWGRASRPPSTRERLQEKAPDYYAWLVREFGLET